MRVRVGVGEGGQEAEARATRGAAQGDEGAARGRICWVWSMHGGCKHGARSGVWQISGSHHAP